MAKISNINELGLELYDCGSQRLSHTITTQLGIVPVNTYRHTNGKLINVFIMTKQLSEFLTIWTKNNPKRTVVKNE